MSQIQYNVITFSVISHFCDLMLLMCVLQGFFVALRLVASAQSGNDVSHNSLNQTVPAPKFVSHPEYCLDLL